MGPWRDALHHYGARTRVAALRARAVGLWRDAVLRYGARTSVDALRARAEGTPMRRTLGAWQLTALGVGAIVGAGVFTVTGLVAADHAGPSVALSFVLVALVSALVALAYAELATLIPLGGSSYTYASAAMGELLGWLVAWALVLSYAIGNGAVASSFSDNFTGLLSAFGADLTGAWTAAPASGGIADLPAAGVCILATLLLLRPVKESATANFVLVVFKTGVLVLFVVVGLFGARSENLVPFAPGGPAGIVAGAGLIFFAFLGFDAISAAAEETKDPQRNLPRGILGSLAIVTVLFVLVSLVLTSLVPSAELGTGEPLAYAMRQAGFGWAGIVLNLAGIVATLSVFLVFQLAITRIVLQVARDGLFPQWFAKVSERHATPNRVTLVLGVLVAFSAALLPLDFLVSLTNESTLFFFAVVCIAVLVLRRTAKDAPRQFRCPGVPYVPLVGAAACVALMVTFDPLIHWGFLAWMGLGVMIYALYGARNSALRRAA